MNTTATTATADAQQMPGEDGRPRFLDEEFDARAGALADWWLDLGRVDLPTANR
jgi:hypothetical protein